MRAAWVLPSFIEGSGGHRTILQNIQYMISQGDECDVYVEDQLLTNLFCVIFLF